ncbi:MAG TPA: YjjG family noncanonical pyrimidine nucleotidase [Niallia sp.]|nr:YjjG family noncanonical pyrimidine nucleotidase [Niallia sp.]
MKTYKTLLFDLDNTLLDFSAAEDIAFRKMVADQGFSYSDTLKKDYQILNQKLWQAYERGEKSRDEVVTTRFSLFFETLGKEVDGILLENRYRLYLEEGNQLMDGALELMKELSLRFDLYIVTNGVSETQDKRLKSSGLFPFFKGVFVSEDTGFQKPMKEFFDWCFAKVPNIDIETTLIIGDSLSADIQGGINVGMDTCWINPFKVKNTSAIQPTYEISHLNELRELLK